MNSTITLHALSANTPHTINPSDIVDVIEARFGGCAILFAGKSLPVHFWESRERVFELAGQALPLQHQKSF